ncbi:uncharacterized protein LOC127838164 [Dreissena polymorpha]|uniref:Kazal-like domain-containing protein n=1 Tax=Dreissena polymorpha TaxID=45954 RepID=A0A9D4F827_DREPO|nr:uncharacterized protein LOC127838164 [Dreissena polymorpha]KAH3791786.1 hypothetical protein DPMN_145276 [Dreissena polymorpha]
MQPPMISIGLFVLLQISVVVWGYQTPNHGHHTQPYTNPNLKPHAIPSGGVVDAAIVNIKTLYTDALCLELLLVDCATHVTKGDEQECGSNRVTYDNHCRFTHAVCETLQFTGQKLTLQSHGTCPNSTVSITISTTVSNTAPIAVSNTTDSSGDIMFNLFCSNVAFITCPGELKVIFGSDSQFYPNMQVIKT